MLWRHLKKCVEYGGHLPAFNKVHMYSGEGIGDRWNDLLNLVIINLQK
jgi:hypothetical protein